MGLYNRLHIEESCRHCGELVERVHPVPIRPLLGVRLSARESVTWAAGKRGRAVNRGRPVEGRAWIPAYAEEACPACSLQFTMAEFAVVVEGERLCAVEQAPAGHHFAEDLDVVPLPDVSVRPKPVADS